MTRENVHATFARDLVSDSEDPRELDPGSEPSDGQRTRRQSVDNAHAIGLQNRTREIGDFKTVLHLGLESRLVGAHVF
jgi:hypothetical protein